MAVSCDQLRLLVRGLGTKRAITGHADDTDNQTPSTSKYYILYCWCCFHCFSQSIHNFPVFKTSFIHLEAANSVAVSRPQTGA